LLKIVFNVGSARQHEQSACGGIELRPVPLLAIGGFSALVGAMVATVRPDFIPLAGAGLGDADAIAWLWPEPPIQPPLPEQIARFLPDQSVVLQRDDGTTATIQYSSVVLDPRWMDLEFFGGWNRESEANGDNQALLFFTGPTFEKGHPTEPLGMVLHGDMKLSNGVWRAGNRAAAAGRAYVAVSPDGELHFGYGDLTPERQARYRLFIGGLHAFEDQLQTPPPSYTGVYGEMRLADVRIVYGLRSDGQLEVIETADGVLFNDLRRMVRSRGFKAAFLPDHASKSRLIVPGQRPWTEEQAVWVSGGKPSITALPFMLRVLPRSLPRIAGTPTGF